jgi:hypothetical protein
MPQANKSAAEEVVFGNLDLSDDDLTPDDDLDEGTQDGDTQDDDSAQDDSAQQLDDLSLAPDDFIQRDRGTIDKRLRYDDKGNIVDAQGKVLALAGDRARLYKNNHDSQVQNAQLRTNLADSRTRLERAITIGTQLAERLKAVEEHGNTGSQLGLNQQEQVEAFQLFAEGKRDPGGLLKKLLTRAAASGIDLTQLGIQAGGFDPKSFIDLMREEMGKVTKPIQELTQRQQQEREQESQRQQRLQETEGRVRTFFEQNPDAQQYLPVFNQVVQRFPGKSLDEIWARIQLQVLQNPRKQRSLPKGRQQRGSDRDGMAPVDTSYDNIIKGVLDKHGV